jgi:hypothetical protein
MSIKILKKIKKSVFLCTSVGKGYYKKIKSEIWLPVVIHKAKPRNNALDVFGGIETIIMPLPRHPPKKVFLPYVSLLRATFAVSFFITPLFFTSVFFHFVFYIILNSVIIVRCDEL